uniref:HAT C-terminal dimerisation domain-containing protein n=1 Tax=Stegastes partitus TaxID=144197 RepID=A0A3B4ZF37_9TELE
MELVIESLICYKQDFKFYPGFYRKLNSKPLSLFCNESLSVLKEYNIRRHHVEKHRAFGTAFPKGTEERATKVQSRLASYNRSCSTLVKTFTAQERATAALAKKKRPFTDSETVRDCMIAIFDEVIHDDKIKASVTSAVKSMPLSDTSNTRRVEILATDVFEALLSDLKKVEVMSIALDDSTDRFDTAQLCVYVHFYDVDTGHTTGEVFFDKILSFFQDNGLDVTRVCMLVTDGALSMTGKVSGLTARWTAVAPRMTFLHCIVHQAVLCAKLNGHFKSVMDNVMATVNFIRATSSLQHRLFLFLHDSEQKKAEAHLNRIMDADFMADVCFLSDLFTHLNRLNLGLQGREKTIIDLVEQTRAFQAKLELFAADLSSGRMLHFPTVHKCITPTAPVTAAMTDLVAKLKDNFASRLDGLSLPTEVKRFTKDPFSALATDDNLSTCAKQVVPSIDEVQFILELVDMQSSLSLPKELRTNGAIQFWSDINVHQFPNLKKIAVTVLSMFGSTYVCESNFSHMNAIKSNLRCSMTDSTLHHCLRIALTSYEPNVTAIVQNKTCHFSH